MALYGRHATAVRLPMLGGAHVARLERLPHGLEQFRQLYLLHRAQHARAVAVAEVATEALAQLVRIPDDGRGGDGMVAGW